MVSKTFLDERNKRIGSDLAKLRRAAGKRQQDLADALGVSYQQVSKYERGETQISAARREAYLEFLTAPVASGLSEEQAPYDAVTRPGAGDQELMGVQDLLKAALAGVTGLVERENTGFRRKRSRHE